MDIDVEIIEVKPVTKNSKKAIAVKPVTQSYYDKENIKYFNKEEYTLLVSNSNKYYQLLYLLLFETGGRVEELRQVTFADIDFDSKKIRIRTLKQREDIVRYRVIPVSDTLKAELLHHKMESGLGKTDFVLSKKSGAKPLIRQSFDKMLKLDCDRLGIGREKAHCHAWRHTRAIQLLESGVDIVKVQKFLGHSSIQNTLIYLKYSNREFDRAILQANESIGLR